MRYKINIPKSQKLLHHTKEKKSCVCLRISRFIKSSKCLSDVALAKYIKGMVLNIAKVPEILEEIESKLFLLMPRLVKRLIS